MTYRDLGGGGSLLRTFDVEVWGLSDGGASEVWTHTQDYLHGPLGLILTRNNGGGNRFFFADHLGTPRVITDGYGTVVAEKHYYPYGTEIAPGGPDERQYKFTGHQRDAHGVTDYMRGRTCAFPLQRFTSVDPGRDGWNLYAYVGGNPLKYTDPSGRSKKKSTTFIKRGQYLIQQTKGDTLHGGPHFHLKEKGRTVARIAEDGTILTGKAPNSVMKFMAKKGLIKVLGGMGVALEILAAPNIEGGELTEEDRMTLLEEYLNSPDIDQELLDQVVPPEGSADDDETEEEEEEER